MGGESLFSIAPESVSFDTSEEFTSLEREPVVEHDVAPWVREICGIPGGEPTALVVHTTDQEIEDNIIEQGFVNVSGRGTLSSVLENEHEMVKIAHQKINFSGPTTMITFCVPAKQLEYDSEGKFGFWFNSKLDTEKYPEFADVYNGIATKYDSSIGEPAKYARDDPNLYPVHIPKQYILGVARGSQSEAV